jgi:ATP-dependent DNA ligase
MGLLRERKSRLVGFIEPCLPSPAKVPPSGPDWIHEIKHEGFRIMARRDAAGVRLITRKGNDLTRRFPFIAPRIRSKIARPSASLTIASPSIRQPWQCDPLRLRPAPSRRPRFAS